MITVEMAREIANDIRTTYDSGDIEAAHCIEDSLMRSALKAAANEDPGYLKIVKIALEVSSESRERWYA